MAGKESSQTVRLTLHLQDDVDGAILKEAVEATRQRYPYHQVRLCTRGDEQGIAHYAFDDNPLPWVVTAGRQQVVLLSQTANHHLLAFAWWDDCIALDNHEIAESRYRSYLSMLEDEDESKYREKF